MTEPTLLVTATNEVTMSCRVVLVILLLPSLAGCQAQILNPARLDDSFGIRGGAAPTNVDLWAGNPASAREAILSASFYPSWQRAAKASLKTDPDTSSQHDTTTSNEDAAASHVAAKVMLLRGVALSDRLCASWFQALSDAQAKLSFDRDVISSSGALASAIMGATGVGAAAISAIGATTGFSQQVVDSAASNFIITPDIGLVQQLVTELRASLAVKLQHQKDPSYSEALIQLVAYDNTCTHARVKQLVNTSVSNSIKTNPALADLDQIKSIAASLAVYFTTAPSIDDVTAIHTVLFPGIAKPEEKLAALKLLVDDGLLKPESSVGALGWAFAPNFAAPARAKAALAAVTNVVQFSYPVTVLAAPTAPNIAGAAGPKTSGLRLDTLTLPSIAK